MTKKTRVRVARIAAGAVIAAGASLTAAGAAQAVGVSFGAEIEIGANGPEDCIPGDASCETPPVTPPVTTPPVTTPPVTTPPVTTPPVTTPPVTTPPVTTPPVTTPPVTTPPTGKPTDKPKPTEPAPGETPAPTTPGDGSDDSNTCTVDLDGAECVDNNPGTNNAGQQPVEQGKAKEELAETGAAETSFLIIGAATMIAGGIGFRMLPRLVGGGRAAV
ncbi:LPXTG cell wall anchor domain-containing protein [Streptomyces sp. NPDC046712]|uniref:LPXTG cell wall anchor domain-containing protein n=1 Tax=Streptomyces sp. NPDC046712 TaxID=3154802 RepID=UPI0033D23B63